MAKKMTIAEHELWRADRTQELIKVSIKIRREFQFFCTLTVHDKFPSKRIVLAYNGAKDFNQDHDALLERFSQARQHHNQPTPYLITKDNLLILAIKLAFNWTRAFHRRADYHLVKLLANLHQLGPPRHMHKPVMKVISREDFGTHWRNAWMIWERVRRKKEEAEQGPVGRNVRRACRRD